MALSKTTNGAKKSSEAPVSGVRTRNLFDPSSADPYKLSRSKLELFLRCPRCFYLDRRLGISIPDSPAMSLNIAVDALLKKEFDLLRARGEAHPMMVQFGIDAVPLKSSLLDEWRDNFRGVRYLDPQTNFLFFGALDDAWVDPSGTIHVVDYKATSTSGAITLDGKWKDGYKRQLEMYQWLLRHSGFDVSDTGYLVFVNADRGRETFDGKLEFTTTILPYEGSDEWVQDALLEAKNCLMRATPPIAGPACEWCAYRRAASAME